MEFELRATPMTLVLSPDDATALGNIYKEAFTHAVELYIATAYLTHWAPGVRLSSRCSRLVFVVGTDFGLTRKDALRRVLRWLPRCGSVAFGAVAGAGGAGFHPKVLAWKTEAGTYECLIGSSNLSRAGLTTNHEANVRLRLTKADYERLTRWIGVLEEQSAAITADWIDHHYTESSHPQALRRNPPALSAPVKLALPHQARFRASVLKRRQHQAAWQEIAGPLLNAMRRTAAGRMSNLEFWDTFWSLWADHPSRFQGGGLQISAKRANWKQACESLLAVMALGNNVASQERDDTVRAEIDRLARARNPARGAWFSEMLCHFYPEQYPILNRPVKVWLAHNKWSARRGSSEGQRYVLLAKQLRVALRIRPAGARTLAELDLAIWQWSQEQA
jgi:hypothetical protein